MILPILDVKDVDASLAFYTQALGFAQQMATPGPDGVNAFAFVRRGNAMIGLNRTENPKVGAGADLMVYVGENDDLEALYNSVKGQGIQTETEIKLQYWGDQTFSLLDPDGYRITMCKQVHETDLEHAAAVIRGDVEAD